MKNIKEITEKLNELYLVRSELEKEELTEEVKYELIAINNQIEMLKWVL